MKKLDMTIYDRELIEDEYNQASGSEDEFEKVKWGSKRYRTVE